MFLLFWLTPLRFWPKLLIFALKSLHFDQYFRYFDQNLWDSNQHFWDFDQKLQNLRSWSKLQILNILSKTWPNSSRFWSKDLRFWLKLQNKNFESLINTSEILTRTLDLSKILEILTKTLTSKQLWFWLELMRFRPKLLRLWPEPLRFYQY